MSDSLQPHGLQNTRLFCPSPSPGACSNSSPSSGCCHPTILSSVTPFSSCLQSFPASGSFPMNSLFASGIGGSALASVLSLNIHGWFPLGSTIWSPCNIIVSIVYMCQFQSSNSSPLLPPQVSIHLHLCLYFCFANKFICITFLDSTYRQYNAIFVLLFLTFFTLYYSL